MKKTTVKLDDGRSITMQCPTVKAVKIANKSEDEMEIAISLISATCNMTKDEVEALPLPDFLTLQDELMGFLGKRKVPTQAA